MAGESSGDDLGAKLIGALRLAEPTCRFVGVGGPAMAMQGLASLFPLADIAVMGIVPVVKRLPLLLRRISETADAVIRIRPDVLVIIDSPDFTHRVARKARAALPSIPVVDYVSPTVWAWRPSRARRMKPYIDHVLALLPFEPAAYRRLNGPACTYVGHPLIADRRPEMPPGLRDGGPVLVLPGSRRSEVRALMPPFGDAVARLADLRPALRFVLPAVPHLRQEIIEAMRHWPVKATLIEGDRAKRAAFATARAAIAASGTVTLELALAGVPMVVAYRASAVEKFIFDHFVTVETIVLPNLIVGTDFIPQFLQQACTGPSLSAALDALLDEGPSRQDQIDGFKRVRQAMQIDGGNPSAKAAEIVLGLARNSPSADA